MTGHPERILLAPDEDSARAVCVSVALTISSKVESHAFHVRHSAPASAVATAMHPALPDEPPGYAEQQVEEIQAAGGTGTQARPRMGQPLHEVTALIEELGADLLVIESGRPVR